MFSAAKNFPNKFFFSIFNIPGDELFIEKGTLKIIIQIPASKLSQTRILPFVEVDDDAVVVAADVDVVAVDDEEALSRNRIS